jgi:hypothetical protein
MHPSGGYIFSWTGLLGTSPLGNRIKRFYIDEKECTRVEIEFAFNMKLVSADCGAFWENAVA